MSLHVCDTKKIMLLFQPVLAGAFMSISDYLLFPQTFFHFTEMHLNITRISFLR